MIQSVASRIVLFILAVCVLAVPVQFVAEFAFWYVNGRWINVDLSSVLSSETKQKMTSSEWLGQNQIVAFFIESWISLGVAICAIPLLFLPIIERSKLRSASSDDEMLNPLTRTSHLVDIREGVADVRETVAKIAKSLEALERSFLRLEGSVLDLPIGELLKSTSDDATRVEQQLSRIEARLP